MVHALPKVYHTRYYSILGDGRDIESTAPKKILRGCVCARCGSGDLKLMKSWVSRWIWLPGGTQRLRVRLARCQPCKARERVLPFDALPGKQAGVDVVVECVAQVVQRSTATFMDVVRDLSKKGLSVSRQLLARWVAGLRARGDDLFKLLRHRALLAPDGCASTRQLVPFARVCIAMRESGPARYQRTAPRDQEAHPTPRDHPR